MLYLTSKNTQHQQQPFHGRSFFWDHPGELVLEENFWTLWCKGRLTEADTVTSKNWVEK